VAVRMELGNQQYVFQDDSGDRADELLITSHGHYWMGLTGSVTVPSWTTLYFFGPHQAALLDPGVQKVSFGMKSYEKAGPGTTVRDYTLSKYQGSHGSEDETYASIKSDIDYNRDIIERAKEATEAQLQPILDSGVKFEKFDVLTVRNRRLRVDPNLSSVLNQLEAANMQYPHILCSFCRSPAIGPSGTHNASGNTGAT